MANELTMIIAGIAVAFNLMIIKIKIEKKRYSDATLDGSLLILLGLLFSGTITGLMIGTVASSIISIYLYFFPPKVKIPEEISLDGIIHEIEERKDIRPEAKKPIIQKQTKSSVAIAIEELKEEGRI